MQRKNIKYIDPYNLSAIDSELQFELRKFEPLFSALVGQPVTLTPKLKNIHNILLQLNFFVKNKHGHNLLWFSLQGFKKTKKHFYLFEIVNMQVSRQLRGQNLQILLQAIIFKYLNISEIRLATTLAKGQNYINRQDIFTIKNKLGDQNEPDIDCLIDLAKCHELIRQKEEQFAGPMN